MDPQEATARSPGTGSDLRPALLPPEEATVIWTVTTSYRCVVPRCSPSALAPAKQAFQTKTIKGFLPRLDLEEGVDVNVAQEQNS